MTISAQVIDTIVEWIDDNLHQPLRIEEIARHEGQQDSRDKLAWLQDLNIFVPVAQQLGNKPESPVKLENVSVIR